MKAGPAAVLWADVHCMKQTFQPNSNHTIVQVTPTDKQTLSSYV